MECVKEKCKKRNWFISLLVVSVLATPAQAESLREVFEQVVKTNPVILQSKGDVDVALESSKQARGDFLPSVTATGSVYNSRRDIRPGDETNYDPKAIGVSLTQTLFAGGGVLSNYRSSKDAHVAAQSTYEVTVQNVLNNVVEAYVDVLTAKDVLNLQESQVKLLTQQLKMTKARFKQGEVTKTDVKQAEARLASSEADRIQAQGDYRTAKNFLTNLVGYAVKNPSWPSIGFDLPATFNEDLESQVLSTHPAVMAAISLLNAKKYDVTTVKAEHYPQISAVASFDRNIDTLTGDYDDRRIGLELSLPLFKGGKTVSAVRSSVASKEQALQALEQQKRDVITDLVNALELYSTSVARHKALQENELAAQLAEEGVSKEQMLGERTVLDLLDARQELLQARVNVTQAKGDMIIQAYSLLKALGELDVEDAQ